MMNNPIEIEPQAANQYCQLGGHYVVKVWSVDDDEGHEYDACDACLGWEPEDD